MHRQGIPDDFGRERKGESHDKRALLQISAWTVTPWRNSASCSDSTTTDKSNGMIITGVDENTQGEAPYDLERVQVSADPE